MQDVQGLINLMGGEQAFENKLNAFMTAPSHGRHATKGMGQYWHANEPDQHALYSYMFIGKPGKTADYIRQCLDQEYKNNDWGISGNEDAGQMSAWYLFSAMGFYPYTHSVPEYVIGTPLFDKVTMNIRGRKLVINAKNNSESNKYIQSATVNGEKWDKTYLLFDDIVNGAEVQFEMGDKPSQWGTSKDARPFSLTK